MFEGFQSCKETCTVASDLEDAYNRVSALPDKSTFGAHFVPFSLIGCSLRFIKGRIQVWKVGFRAKNNKPRPSAGVTLVSCVVQQVEGDGCYSMQTVVQNVKGDGRGCELKFYDNELQTFKAAVGLGQT